VRTVSLAVVHIVNRRRQNAKYAVKLYLPSLKAKRGDQDNTVQDVSLPEVQSDTAGGENNTRGFEWKAPLAVPSSLLLVKASTSPFDGMYHWCGLASYHGKGNTPGTSSSSKIG